MSTIRLMQLSALRPVGVRTINRSASRSSTRSASGHASPSGTGTGPTPIRARVLEQPDRFRPPSHSARLPRKNRAAFPGPALSEKERAAQKTRSYPHMMPPEGTFAHWFLTSRLLHTWISLSVLMSLAGYVILTNFLSTTIYRDQLPPNSLFSSHPIRFLKRYWEVYQMHTLQVSAETAERRRMNVDDVRKRGEYRAAHGIEEKKAFLGLGGSTAATPVDGQIPVVDGLGADGRAMIEARARDV